MGNPTPLGRRFKGHVDFAADGTHFKHKDMYPERLICYVNDDEMDYAIVGELDDTINNEVELMRSFTFAEVFNDLRDGLKLTIMAIGT